MNLKAFIIDDEEPARQELRYLLEEIEGIKIIGEAGHAKEALKFLNNNNCDIVFLDIQMPGMTGLELGEVLQASPSSPLIIFTTAFEEYAVKAFDINAVDYLLKPYDISRLEQAVSKVKSLANSMKTTTEKNNSAPKEHKQSSSFDRLPVEQNGKTLLVSQDEIIFAYTQEDTVYIKTHKDSFTGRYTLKELETRLDENVFFRTHRCYIVNLSKVKEITPFFNGTYTLAVNDAQTSQVPVSRNQARKLKKLLGI